MNSSVALDFLLGDTDSRGLQTLDLRAWLVGCLALPLRVQCGLWSMTVCCSGLSGNSQDTSATCRPCRGGSWGR